MRAEHQAQRVALVALAASLSACMTGEWETYEEPGVVPDGKADSGGEPAEGACAAIEGGQALREVYYTLDGQPWQSCYTTTHDRALELIASGSFEGSTQLVPEDYYVQGESIFVRRRYVEGYEQFEHCIFDQSDNCALQCTITFQDSHQPELAGEPYVTRHAYCLERDPGYEVVDCEAGVAHPITNTWRQPLSRIEYELMRHILSLPWDGVHSAYALVPSIAYGGVGSAAESQSLDGCMEWSSGLGFTFTENRQGPEVCDWSVEQMYPDFGTWCPWGIQVVRVQCDGYPEIVNPRAPTALPLDFEDPAVRDFCGSDSGPITAAAQDMPRAIPDLDPSGIESVIEIEETGAVESAELDLYVRHPYRGDLYVRVACPNGTWTTIHRRSGGGADDLVGTFQLPACRGSQIQGRYRLRVSDLAYRDVGSLESWTLRIER